MAGGGSKPGKSDGQGISASFNCPEGITYKQGMIYVSDSANNVIRTLSLDVLEVITYAGTGKPGQINGNKFAYFFILD